MLEFQCALVGYSSMTLATINDGYPGADNNVGVQPFLIALKVYRAALVI